MQSEFNARTVALFWACIGFTALLFSYALLNDRVFHPREPIGFRDVDVLKQELNQVIESTSSVGTWRNRWVVERPLSFGLAVSATYHTHQRDERAMSILIGALQQHGWQSAGSYKEPEAISTFCKGRYRVGIYPFGEEKGALILSFGLKKYKDDLDCV